jgi:hypothetical protein
VTRRVAVRAERAQVPQHIGPADLTRHDVIDLRGPPAAAPAGEAVAPERLEPQPPPGPRRSPAGRVLYARLGVWAPRDRADRQRPCRDQAIRYPRRVRPPLRPSPDEDGGYPFVRPDPLPDSRGTRWTPACRRPPTDGAPPHARQDQGLSGGASRPPGAARRAATIRDTGRYTSRRTLDGVGRPNRGRLERTGRTRTQNATPRSSGPSTCGEVEERPHSRPLLEAEHGADDAA